MKMSYRDLVQCIKQNKISEAKKILLQNLRGVFDKNISLYDVYSKNAEANLELVECLFDHSVKNLKDLMLVKNGIVEYLNNSINDEEVFKYCVDRLSVSDKFTETEKKFVVENFLSLWVGSPNFKDRFKYAYSTFQDIEVEKFVNLSIAKEDSSFQTAENALWLLTEFKKIDATKLNYGSFLLNVDQNAKKLSSSSTFQSARRVYRKLQEYFDKHKRNFEFSDVLYVTIPKGQCTTQLLSCCKGIPGYDDEHSFYAFRRYDECEFSKYSMTGHEVICSDLSLNGTQIFSFTPIELMLRLERFSFNDLKDVITFFNLNLSLNERNVFEFIDYDRKDIFEWLLSDDYAYHSELQLKYDEFKVKHLTTCIDKADLDALKWLVEESNFKITLHDLEDCLQLYEKNGEFGLFDAFRTSVQRECLRYCVEVGADLSESMKKKLKSDMEYETPSKKLQKILDDKEVTLMRVKRAMRKSGISEALIKKYCSCERVVQAVSVLGNTDKDFLKSVYNSKTKRMKLKLNL